MISDSSLQTSNFVSIKEINSLKNEDLQQQLNDFIYKETNFQLEIECQKPQSTHLTQNTIDILINEYESRNQGLFQSAYVSFKIETKPLNWTVWRRFSDFAWLRNILVKAFPCTLIPPIPKKKIKVHSTEQNYLQKRMKVMALFLQSCLLHPELRTHMVLQDFLSLDESEFKEKQLTYDRMAAPQRPSEYVKASGVCKLEITESIKSYALTLQDYLKNSTDIYQKLSLNFKKLFVDLENLSTGLQQIQSNFNNLRQVTDNFCKLNQNQTLGGLQMIQLVYDQFSKFFQGWNQSVTLQSNNVKENFYEFFRYHRKMQDQALQFVNQRNQMETKFYENRTKLNEKKEKLYQSAEYAKWDLPVNMPTTIKELQNNRQEAMKYILSNESKNLNDQRDNFSYMNHQIIDEIHEMMDFRIKAYCEKFTRLAQLRSQETHEMHNCINEVLGMMTILSKKTYSKKRLSVYLEQNNQEDQK